MNSMITELKKAESEEGRRFLLQAWHKFFRENRDVLPASNTECGDINIMRNALFFAFIAGYKVGREHEAELWEGSA